MPLVEYDQGTRGVATVIVNDPATRNALSDWMLDELIGRLEQVRADDSVGVVVLGSESVAAFRAKRQSRWSGGNPTGEWSCSFPP
ncbi:hypothetical protein I6A84_00645 [Frankia sp. CNm7]|uniref:Enoyl-CoA hydratase n=1 Tax=Frankia nepalensis TaxID=1836974 RepID=A0A937RCM2_9ACTN|nr:enoyl-CoA hydratase-related protein [Frankia nepalensis]MBL7496663.1 hypothetical protein [Frankia nepalensis]MBL7510695.1 hypothetical protein [Frankia nepalensis]MBL7516672.1 hypothetical protein [Frankia nepalensis]MBL7627402.1 hypothetical protein [Frankia nepalensis]